jgi:hypothetical protein
MKITGLQTSTLRWWTERPPREKLLLCVCAVGVLFGVAESGLIAPIDKKIKQAQAQHAGLSARLEKDLKQRGQQAAVAAVNSERETELRERVRAAQARVVALNARLQESAQLPQVLRAITATVGAAKLLELQLSDDTSTPTAPVANALTPLQALGLRPRTGAASAPSTADAAAPRAASAGPPPAAPLDSTEPAAAAGAPAGMYAGRRLYQLPITLKVSGTWDELNLLLTQIERHAQALQWHSVELNNSQWPAIELTLKAHATSLQPRWGDHP